MESYLFRQANIPCMLLYRNKPSVVIGRNQNPWTEANLEYLKKYHIELVRRYSGGGAVYHDLGNTNYSYMMPRAVFDRDSTANVIISGLQAAGLDVALNARHDISIRVDDKFKKCSGSAYKISKDRAYAHGTMLLTSDLGNLGPALRPDECGIKGNGVESVRSEVANLAIEHAEFCGIVAAAFQLDARTVSEEEMLALSDVRKSVAQLQSDEWKFLQTPKFTQIISLGDGQELTATIKQGRYCEFQGPKYLMSRSEQLQGQLFEPSALHILLNSNARNEQRGAA